MSQPTISVVIRTLNEVDSLRELLIAITNQKGIDRNTIEIIVVDNESTDKTQDIAREYGARVVTLPRNQFTYPKSMNLGMAAAKAPIVVLTVGHALPIGPHWLTSILPHFNNPKVVGVYGSVLPNKGCGFFERLMYWQNYVRARIFNSRTIRRIGVGVFGATNIALRRELWLSHPFENQYELGGEDTHWAEWAFSQGYVIIRETGFTVRHSHGLSLFGYIAQIRYWHRLNKPTKFSRDALSYRKNIHW